MNNNIDYKDNNENSILDDIEKDDIEKYDIESDVNSIVNKQGLLIFLYFFIKVIPLLIIKKIIKRIK